MLKGREGGREEVTIVGGGGGGGEGEGEKNSTVPSIKS